MFEDKKGEELVHMQAEKDFSELVKNDQSSTVLNGRSASIGASDSLTVGASISVNVIDGESRMVGTALSYDVGELHSIHVASGTGTEISDRRIVSSTGGASITLDGDNILIEAKGQIIIRSTDVAQFHSQKEIQIDAPMTFVNCAQATAPEVPTLEAAQAPSGPGGGGDTNDSTYRPAGQGQVQPPGGFDEAAPNAFVGRPPQTAAEAPAQVSIDPAAAQAITQQVAQAAPVQQLASAALGGLVPAEIGRALNVVNAVRTFRETGGQSLLQIPELREAVGSLVTQPIAGGVSGADIANILNAGDQFGIWHLSDDTRAATGFVRAASPEAGAQAAAPAGVTQMMGVRSEAAPARIDGSMLERDMQVGRAQGLPPEAAQATALAQQGVALYRGDFTGRFTRILGG